MSAAEITPELPVESGTAASNSPQRVQASLDAACVVRLVARKGRFLACIPELGLLAEARTVEAAHAEVLRLREARIREFAAEGLLDELPAPDAAQAGALRPEGLLSRLKVFLIKAAVVAALFLGAVNVIGSGLRDTGYVLEKKLDAVTNWDAVTQEKHRAKAAQIAAKLAPVVQELLVVFDRPAPRPAALDNATAPAP